MDAMEHAMWLSERLHQKMEQVSELENILFTILCNTHGWQILDPDIRTERLERIQQLAVEYFDKEKTLG